MAEIITLPSGWRLVTCGGCQISVAPDSTVHFPMHITPDQVPDFVAAVKAAAEVGVAEAHSDVKSPAPTPRTTGATTGSKQHRAAIGRRGVKRPRTVAPPR